MALFDVVRAGFGCSGADWLEVLVRVVVAVAAVQQASLLFWLRGTLVRR
jgi:hypothetical protein